MAEYIYFCVSLPFLYYGKEPPLSSQKFLQLASTNLSYADFQKIDGLDFSCTNQRILTSSFLQDYYRWEIALRNQVMLQRLKTVEQRNAKLRNGGVGSTMLTASLEQLLQQEPLAIEQGLDLLRWNKLNELCGARLFDMFFIAIYFLKLKVLERAVMWQKELGKEQYEKVSKELVEEVGGV